MRVICLIKYFFCLHINYTLHSSSCGLFENGFFETSVTKAYDISDFIQRRASFHIRLFFYY